MSLPWMFSSLRTERLRLDLLQPDDLDALHAIQSDPDVCRYLLFEPRSREEVARVLAESASWTTLAQTGDSLRPALRTADGTLAGWLFVHVTNASDGQAEIGWTLAASAQGKGYAFEAASALMEALFREAGFHRLHAQLDARNSASAALCERLGMRREGLFREDMRVKGEWTDSALYAMLAREWDARRESDTAARA